MHRLHVYERLGRRRVAAGTGANMDVMSRRRRSKLRAARQEGRDVVAPVRPERRDHMARVHVDDATWQTFKSVTGYTPISEVLGQLVTHHVHNHQARQAAAGELGDPELLEALERARELQRELRLLIQRLEDRRSRRA
jgi:hypothetical protein